MTLAKKIVRIVDAIESFVQAKIISETSGEPEWHKIDVDETRAHLCDVIEEALDE